MSSRSCLGRCQRSPPMLQDGKFITTRPKKDENPTTTLPIAVWQWSESPWAAAQCCQFFELKMPLLQSWKRKKAKSRLNVTIHAHPICAKMKKIINHSVSCNMAMVHMVIKPSRLRIDLSKRKCLQEMDETKSAKRRIRELNRSPRGK